jgi:hypothetical protein
MIVMFECYFDESGDFEDDPKVFALRGNSGGNDWSPTWARTRAQGSQAVSALLPSSRRTSLARADQKAVHREAE